MTNILINVMFENYRGLRYNTCAYNFCVRGKGFMIAYILIGILVIAVVILAFLFFKEKKANEQREKTFYSELTKSVSELQQEQNDSTNHLNESISGGFDEINSLIDDVLKRFDEKMQDTDAALQEYVNDTKLRFSDASEAFNKKIELLATIIEQISKDNADLRKKLEFFTEIDSDSKRINETEDVEKREALIQQALKELSLDSQANESLPEEKESLKEEYETIGNQQESSTLDNEQKAAFKIMEMTSDNLFITGKAGTGKSFLLDTFRSGTKKKTLTLAPTGIAALNVKGVTIHTAFGYDNLEKISIEDLSASTLRLKNEKQQVLKEIDTLIIDEISMVRVDTFDKIDKILKIINKNAKPFGGKQVIVFGDLFQLPPIVQTEEERKYLAAHYDDIFFFNSIAYSKGNFGFMELTKNHRQKDDKQYFEVLNRIREGRFDNSDLDKLNSRLVHNKEELRRVMTLFPKKDMAEALNKAELARIEAKEYVYKAQITKNLNKDKTLKLEKRFPIAEELHLKRGALVMMVANDQEKRWVNGTIGIIHSLYDDRIMVTINGMTYEVYKTDFTQREAIYESGKIVYKDILTVMQYPIVLAYAITIHKSQGMTYQHLACDISKCFAPGQAYVALSRCSSIDGLHLLTKINGTGIQPNKTVVDFYNNQLMKKAQQA